jgi:ABC-type nitrate/sulfonate/bicarbonate transport system ATPase subunit
MFIKGLDFTYGQDKLFEDFNFSSDHPVTALKGPSGCGKTTLLKLISGYIKPNSVIKTDIPKDPLLVLQEDALLPWESAEKNMTLFMNSRGLTLQIPYSAEQLLGPLLKKKAFELSYGQRRFVEILRAVLVEPDLLLLDEPFNFLDNIYKEALIGLIKQITAQSTKVIISSHYGEDFADLNAHIFYFGSNLPIRTLKD